MARVAHDPAEIQRLLQQTSNYTREIVAILREAAEHDDRGALTQLGVFHDEGLRDRGGRVLVRRDPRRARAYLRRAVDLGDRNGMLCLANHLTWPPFTRNALAEAEALYQRAFRLGDTSAAFNLACTYQSLERYRDAVRWFRKALAAGDVSAAVEVARAELYGLGTRRDTRAAFAKLRGVARRRTRYWPRDCDRTEAMLIMADALITGWPARRDYDEGQRWLRRAAKLGSGVAKALLTGA